MPTTPLNGLPSPDDESPNLPPIHFDALNAILDSRLPARFSTISARDAAYAAYVAAGGTLVNGMSHWVDNPGSFYERIGGAWVQRRRTIALTVSNTTDASGVVTGIHGLGVTPSAAMITRATFPAANIADARVTALSSTQVQIVSTRTDTGATLAANPVTYYCEVIA